MHLNRSKETALLMSDTLGEPDVIRMAAGLYALYRVVNYARFCNTTVDQQSVFKLLGSFSKRALEGSQSRHLLNFIERVSPIPSVTDIEAPELLGC